MKRFALVLAAAAGMAFVSKASATTGLPWFDSFDTGVGSSYQAWPGGNESNLQGSSSHDHTGNGGQSAWAPASDPAAWSSSYTLNSNTAGVTGGFSSDVWVWDDNSVAQSGTTPVNDMLALAGANGTSTPGFGTDYAELGIIAGNTANQNDYVIRVRSYDQAHGTTWFDTGVGRTAGWTHLQIVADPNPSDGGDGLYHFFINGVNVDPGSTTLSRNTSVGLEWDRIGSNSKTYENFWYDDFNIQATPEPASMALLGMGALGLLARRRRQA